MNLSAFFSQWYWVALGALAALAAYLQMHVARIQCEAGKREELFQIITENAADMIALVDTKGRRLYNSPAYKRILGYSAAELGETSAFEQIHPDDRFKILEAAREAKQSGIGQRLEYRVRHKNGSWKILESVAGTIRDDNGAVAKLVIVNRDITDRKLAEAALEHNSFHDEMTGLANRRLFLDRLQQIFLRNQRNAARQYAVVALDLDSFKVFNQTMGQASGDRVILEICRRLATCLRNDDTISNSKGAASSTVLSRMGGDEFTILLDDVGDPSDALRIAKRMLEAIADPVMLEGVEVKTSASIGMALSAAHYRRPEDILHDADSARRRAKALGGARCELFDAAMHGRAVSRLKLEGELRRAMAENQFLVYYQPIVRLHSREIASFEALLRWQHPQQGLVSPYKFLATAEDMGLLIAIGEWLITEACRQLRDWQSRNIFPHPIHVTVNVSARQFADSGLLGMIKSALLKTGVDGSQLQLELTENVAAHDPRLTASMLAHFRHMGVSTILDDFGAGHCSLMALTALPVDGIKIDRSLVGQMLTDRRILNVVELIITIAHKLRFKTIAEGIETRKQLDFLRELRCDLGQGYLFSPPLAAAAAEKFLIEEGDSVRLGGQSGVNAAAK